MRPPFGVEQRLALKRMLNRLVARAAGRHVTRILGPAIGAMWRRMDRAAAWPELHPLIDLVPSEIWGGVGGDSYTAWVYQQGFLAGLLAQLRLPSSARVVDLGCGFGKLAPVSAPFTAPDGEYVGIDIREACVAFCRDHYRGLPRARFVLAHEYNATYSDASVAPPPGPRRPTPASPRGSYAAPARDWGLAPASVDLFLAISFFTHLQDADARAYLGAMRDALRPGGRAVLTFILVRDGTPRSMTSLPGIDGYFTKNPARPEDLVGISPQALERLLEGLLVPEQTIPAVTGGRFCFPQDVMVARKQASDAAAIRSDPWPTSP